NNRVNFRVEHNGTVNLSQVQNYYPFGETMGDSTMNYTTTPVDLYQYSGKEIQPELNLNTYDFGARNYNPVLARWLTMDPLAVGYEDQSPYNYVGNNPLNLIDPDGMQPSGGGISPGQMASADIIIHSGSGGSAAAGSAATSSGGSWGSWGWVGAGANALGQGISAFNATTLRTTTVTDFNAAKNVQGNVISPARNYVNISYGPNAKKVLSYYTINILQSIGKASGERIFVINSTYRTASEQARAMFQNIQGHGIKHQLQLYNGKPGEQVIEAYQQKGTLEAMIDKINELGPENVSSHSRNFAKVQVVDISPLYINSFSRFRNVLKQFVINGTLNKFIMPPQDPAFHLEIPQKSLSPQLNRK
ncbi:RHS repeat-associated core domain-containing protein, partial [Mucilaginibacter panaciglaebae]|uniref:RHS repeat domain-containing protein n=1 Tax=Mucilaginibacter panaciglaebae TaxID=502331 RepID=UPI0031F1103C